MPGTLLGTGSLKMNEAWPLPFRRLESCGGGGGAGELDIDTDTFQYTVVTENIVQDGTGAERTDT